MNPENAVVPIYMAARLPNPNNQARFFENSTLGRALLESSIILGASHLLAGIFRMWGHNCC